METRKFSSKFSRSEQLSRRYSIEEKEKNVLHKQIDELVKTKTLMLAEAEEAKLQEFFVAKYQKLIYG